MLDGDDRATPRRYGAGAAGPLRRRLRHRRRTVPRRRQADPRLRDRRFHRPRRPGGGRRAGLRRPGRDEPRRGPGRRVRGHRHHRGGRGPRRRGQRGGGAALRAGRHGQDPPGRAPARSPRPARGAGSTTPPSCTPPTPGESGRSGSSRSPTDRTSGSECWSAPTAARSPCTSTTPRASTAWSVTTPNRRTINGSTPVPKCLSRPARVEGGAPGSTDVNQAYNNLGATSHAYLPARRHRPDRARRRHGDFRGQGLDVHGPLVLHRRVLSVQERLLGRHPDGVRRRASQLRTTWWRTSSPTATSSGHRGCSTSTRAAPSTSPSPT